jgi:rRNA maturation endonuclease Nob1
MSNDEQKPKERVLGPRWLAGRIFAAFEETIEDTIEDNARAREEVVRQGLDRAFKYCPLCGKEDVRTYSTGSISCLECGANWEHKVSFLGSHSIKLKKASYDGFGNSLVGTFETPDYWQNMGIRKHKEEEDRLQNAFHVDASITQGPTPSGSTQALFCANCGKQNRSEDNFCSNCGSQLLKNSLPADSRRNEAHKGVAIEPSVQLTSSSASVPPAKGDVGNTLVNLAIKAQGFFDNLSRPQVSNIHRCTYCGYSLQLDLQGRPLPFCGGCGRKLLPVDST